MAGSDAGTIKARVRVEGTDRAKRALRGVREEAKRGERESKSGHKQHTEVAVRESKKRVDHAKREEQERRRIARRTADEAKRAEEKATRETEKGSRARISALRRFAREARSVLGGMGTLVGTAGVAAAGAASAVRGRGQAYAGAMGVRSQEQLFADYVGYERGLQTLSVKRGYDAAGTEELRQRVTGISMQTGLGQEQVLGALNQAQERYAEQFDRFATLFPDIAGAASAAGASLEDVVTFLGNIGRANPDLSDDDMRTVLHRTVSQGLSGSVEFASLAQAFGTLPGAFAAQTRRRGMDAVNEQLLLAQALATGGASDSETATAFERLLARLARPETQKRAERVRHRNGGGRGIAIADEEGVMRPILDIINDLKTAGLDNPRGLSEILGADIYGTRATNTLLNAITNEDFMNAVNGASAEQGQEYIAQWHDRMNQSGVRRAELLSVRQMAEFENSGGLRSDAAQTVMDVAETLTIYETRHWEVIEALGILKTTLMTMAGAQFVKQHMLGGSSVSSMLGLGGASAGAGGGAAAAAGGGLLGAAGVAGAGALAGAAGYEAASAATESGSLFRNGLPGAYRELSGIAQGEGGPDAALERFNQATAFTNEGAIGMLRSLIPGAGNLGQQLTVVLAPESRQALASDVARASGEQSARGAGGPARRGGG